MDNKTFDNPADMLLGASFSIPEETPKETKPEVLNMSLKEKLDNEKQTKKKLIIMGPTLFETIERKAKADGRSVNNYIINALKEYVLK